MPRPKPSALTGTAELNAMIERVAPAILGLLADGVPRTKAAIVAALAGRHAEADVALALVRLAVTGGWSRPAASTRWRARTGRPRPPDPRRSPRPLRALLGAAGRGVPGPRGLPPADRRPWARWRGLAGHPDEETALRGPRGAGEAAWKPDPAPARLPRCLPGRTPSKRPVAALAVACPPATLARWGPRHRPPAPAGSILAPEARRQRQGPEARLSTVGAGDNRGGGKS